MQDLVSLRFLLLILPGWLALPPPSEAHQGCDNFTVNLQPPSNLTAAQRGIGLINYSWSPSHLEHTKKYILRYESSFKYDGGDWQGTKVNPLSNREEVLLLNKGILFRVKALLALTTEENSSPPTCQQSGWVYTYTGAIEGDNNTTITNFNCFFYNFEYVNCTWTSGSMAPSDTTYIFHYWQTFMDTIQNCTNYTKNGRHVGCLISRDPFDADKDLNIRVSGSSVTAKIKPFFYKLESYAFVKLQPPWLKNVSKTREGIYVNWEIPEHWKKQCLLYEVRVKSSKASSWNSYLSKDQEKNITDADLNSKNSIQVRVQYTTICGKSGLWSEWSEVQYIGEDTKEWNWDIALLVFIPVLVAAIAIICLTNLKKLKKWILPPIPDPGKLLRGVFGDSNGDNTIRNKQLNGSLTLKPEMELTCNVTTVEQLKFPAESERKLIVNECSEENEEVPMDDNYMQYNLVTS